MERLMKEAVLSARIVSEGVALYVCVTHGLTLGDMRGTRKTKDQRAGLERDAPLGLVATPHVGTVGTGVAARHVATATLEAFPAEDPRR
jgi:hypothetical protein